MAELPHLDVSRRRGITPHVTVEPTIRTNILALILEKTSLDLQAQSRILSTEGLSLGELQKIDGRMKFHSYLRILEQICDAMRDPRFGLTVSRQLGPSSVGAVGYLFLCAPTLGEAFRRFERYVSAIQDVSSLRTRLVEGNLEVIYSIYDDTLYPQRNDAEFSLGVVQSLTSQYLARKFEPICVKFQHPPAGLISDYETWFGCEVFFEQPINSITVRKADLRHASTTYDVNLTPILESYLRNDQNTQISRKYFSDHTRSLISDALVERKKVTASSIAEMMGLSSARLHRRLQSEETSFSELALEKKMELGCRLLLDTRASILEIADRLGYSETSAFTRAFRNHVDLTPSAYRSQNKFL